MKIELVSELISISKSLYFLGTKIINDTGIKNLVEYPYDERFYIPLWNPTKSQVKKYCLDTKKFKRTHDFAMKRIVLWFANLMNVPSEVCSLPRTDEFTGKTSVSGDSPALTIGNGKYSTEKNDPHLFCSDPSIVFGGFRGKCHKGDLVDQISHIDIGGVTKRGVEYSVSNNPDLKNRFKACSIIIPLEGHRNIYHLDGSQKSVVRVSAGEAEIFTGDSTHGGVTTEPENPMEWNPSIHLCLSSTHHPRDLSVFEIDSVAIGAECPKLLHRCKSDAKLQAVEPLAAKCIDGFRAALIGGEDDKDGAITNALGELINDLQDIKAKHGKTGGGGVAKKRRR